MKILFITRGFPSAENPMNGNYEAVQAKAMAKRGHEVYCMCICNRSLIHVGDYHKISNRVVNGVSVYEMPSILPYLPKLPHIPCLENRCITKDYDYLYRYIIKKHGVPDIVHCQCLYVLQYAAVIKKRYKIPFVHSEHWSEVNKEKVDERVMAMGQSYQYPDKIITVSKALSDSLHKLFGVYPVVVNNMVDDSFFSPVKKVPKMPCFKFISVGRLVYDKHFDLLIQSFAEAGFGKNVTLDIVGMGEEFHFLQDTIRKYKVEDQVHLVGLQPPAVVAKMLESADCFVLTSRLETFGIVIIEAMAKGLPVISVPCGGPEEIIVSEVGILTKDRNPKTISEAMTNMVNNRHRFDSNYIRKYCYDNYSQESIAKAIESIYKQIIIQ